MLLAVEQNADVYKGTFFLYNIVQSCIRKVVQMINFMVL